MNKMIGVILVMPLVIAMIILLVKMGYSAMWLALYNTRTYDDYLAIIVLITSGLAILGVLILIGII